MNDIVNIEISQPAEPINVEISVYPNPADGPVGVNTLTGITYSFIMPASYTRDYFEEQVTIEEVLLNGAATLTYSFNGSVYAPVAQGLIIPASTWVMWHVTYNPGSTIASIYIKI